MFYVYLIQEYPLESTPFCKVGVTKDPLKRLESLQQGNPRYLRPYCQLENKPDCEFGICFESESDANKFESDLLAALEAEGVRLSRDGGGKLREWLQYPPKYIWDIMVKQLCSYRKLQN
ncbi:GIY-YIG nuclease family protein [uncultured Shewanella sp.]|uniref:GIY-YIG nuclease family protein n=1 Tax=uncultured Shewanella sp. TaxID=173975 RepID=UPI00260FFC78|nr:GIY-YIG nuclease family protein [uncultured Shewanella sp.]